MSRIIDEASRELLQIVITAKNEQIYPYCLEVTTPCANRIVVNDKECINFISNNYLGFSNHPKVKEAALAALNKYGAGMGGSPMMCGTTEIHNQLKQTIATVYGQEDTALFATGYQALLGAVQATVTKKDLVLIDSLVHRSIVDGVTLSGALRRVWKHNDLQDLSKMLDRLSKHNNRKLIIVDSVYSMDGDIAPLPEIKRLSDSHQALVLVDEAHALGIIGDKGHGILDHFSQPDGADVIAGTFSKYAGAVGGFVCGPAAFINHLIHFSSSFIFSASLPPVMCAVVLAAFELLETEPQWRENLWSNTHYFLNGLKHLGFNTGKSETPIIPIIIGNQDKALQFNKCLLELGVYASPVVYPAVAQNKTRMRLGVMATHSMEDLDKGLDALAKAGKEIGLI